MVQERCFLLNVSEIMSRHPVRVSSNDTIEAAATLMKDNNVGALPVLDGGVLKGIVTDRDIAVRGLGGVDIERDSPVTKVMSRNVVTVSEDSDIREAAKIMATNQVRRLPVVSEGALTGIISLCDLTKSSPSGIEASMALSEISQDRKSYYA